jgi:hypothetical protein
MNDWGTGGGDFVVARVMQFCRLLSYLFIAAGVNLFRAPNTNAPFIVSRFSS